MDNRRRDPRDSRENDSSNSTPGNGEFRIRGASRRYEDVDAPREPRYEDRRPPHRNRDRDPYYDRTVVYEEPEGPPDNTGDEDVAPAGTKSRFLLIRGLKVNTDEELLSKGLAKFYLDDSEAESKPDALGATPDSLKRVFIIRDRVTNKSLKYGFAEYHSTADAGRAIDKSQDMGDKCTISSSRISLDPVDPGVFAPVFGNNQDQRYAFEHNGGLYQYRDRRYYASVSTINAEAPQTESPPPEPTQPTKKRSGKEALDSIDSGKVKKPKTTLSIAAKWQEKQAELRGETDAKIDTTSNQDPEVPETIPQSYIWQREVDGKKKTSCLLCLTDVAPHIAEAHVKQSAKHAAHLKDEEKCKQGLENLKKRGVDPESTLQVMADQPEKKEQPEFQDRAALRRQMEAKSDAAAKKINISLGSKPASTPKFAPKEPSYGKGMSMLQKHGWKSGDSLGTSRDSGRKDIIETNMYAAGVGLGHEGGKIGDAVKEAERMTGNGGSGFVEKTRDVARERFERMG